MKNARVVDSLIILFLVIDLVLPVSARTEEMPPKKKMVRVIKERLEVFPEIAGMVPELFLRKRSGAKEEETEIEYFYTSPDGIAVKLEELDAEPLYDLYGLVNRESTRLSTERIMKQLDQQRQLRMLQDLQRMSGGPVEPTQQPSVPRVYIPPSIPRQPPASAAPPRPPEPPRRQY